MLTSEGGAGRLTRIDLATGARETLAQVNPGIDNFAIAADGRLFVSHFTDGRVAEVTGGVERVLSPSGLIGPFGLGRAGGFENLVAFGNGCFQSVKIGFLLRLGLDGVFEAAEELHGEFIAVRTHHHGHGVSAHPFTTHAFASFRAAIGLGGYAALLVLAFLRSRAAAALALLGALLGLGFSLYLTYIEAYVLATWCILCLGSLATIAKGGTATCTLLARWVNPYLKAGSFVIADRACPRNRADECLLNRFLPRSFFLQRY